MKHASDLQEITPYLLGYTGEEWWTFAYVKWSGSKNKNKRIHFFSMPVLSPTNLNFPVKGNSVSSKNCFLCVIQSNLDNISWIWSINVRSGIVFLQKHLCVPPQDSRMHAVSPGGKVGWPGGCSPCRPPEGGWCSLVPEHSVLVSSTRLMPCHLFCCGGGGCGCYAVAHTTDVHGHSHHVEYLWERALHFCPSRLTQGFRGRHLCVSTEKSRECKRPRHAMHTSCGLRALHLRILWDLS